ncbi:hypothetical protein JDV02_008089 [Purpureocillium takamizusanense]|uniref:Uncharacterized protein n=1 Tax=Purpureocillium takamizusanense TaxID=2060973 RepID=A0A9Q8QPI7_9HYPO|nr:uncharacterized protein JDV02_008089 [Purpureocillium takamizusanense]UNI22177.1 hypothetical protein JDV02_008089 [Purpureocillium takamizusanense]
MAAPPPAVRRQGMHPIDDIANDVTVIITTSPTPSAPGTDLIAAVARSFGAHCPSLLACPVVVVLDTFDSVGDCARLKKGVVTAEGAAQYDAYKRNVKRFVLGEYRRRPHPPRHRDARAADEDAWEQGCPDAVLVESRDEAEYGFEGRRDPVALHISRTADGRITFVEPTRRLGFGLAVRSALRLATTPYVWVQQHDWPLAADIPLRSILRVMDASACGSSSTSSSSSSSSFSSSSSSAAAADHDDDDDNYDSSADGSSAGNDDSAADDLCYPRPPVKYVCLPSTRMRSYATSNHVVKFPALRALTAALKGDFVVDGAAAEDADHHRHRDDDDDGGRSTVPLTPLFFWHDKPHVASRAHYLERVFGTRLAVQRGAFIEDLVGQRARDQMKRGTWARWACWLYYPDEGTRLCVRHLQGRTWKGVTAAAAATRRAAVDA